MNAELPIPAVHSSYLVNSTSQPSSTEDAFSMCCHGSVPPLFLPLPCQDNSFPQKPSSPISKFRLIQVFLCKFLLNDTQSILKLTKFTKVPLAWFSHLPNPTYAAGFVAGELAVLCLLCYTLAFFSLLLSLDVYYPQNTCNLMSFRTSTFKYLEA